MNENPAKKLDCKLFIDLPVIPNFSFNAFHSGFTINDAIPRCPTCKQSASQVCQDQENQAGR